MPRLPAKCKFKLIVGGEILTLWDGPAFQQSGDEGGITLQEKRIRAVTFVTVATW